MIRGRRLERAIALMEQGRVVDLNRATALGAERFSIQCRIAMVGGIMVTTAQEHRATLWTQDSDFNRLPDINYCARPEQNNGRCARHSRVERTMGIGPGGTERSCLMRIALAA